jgi:serine/threonine protein kinase/Flp pilus assembly protein TadD
MQTPGNPFADLPPMVDTLGTAAHAPEPIGVLGEHLLVYEVRRGGMGEVYLCGTVGADGPQLALKTFQRRFFFDRTIRDAFVREATVWSRVSGRPHVMPALGLHEFDGRPFVMMQPVPADATVRGLLVDGALDEQSVLVVAIQSAIGMNGAQQELPGLVHGDLKPENLLLLGPWVAVSDFGLASVATMADTGTTGVLESTWAYRAPELWTSDVAPSVASDLYAYGCVLFELMTGRPPWYAANRDGWRQLHRHRVLSQEPPQGGDIPFEAASPLAAQLMSITRRCLEPDPTRRPADFEEVLTQLLEIASEGDPAAALELMMSTSAMAERLRQDLHYYDIQRVRSLSQLHDYDGALAELRNVPIERWSAELHALHGSLLSLTGEDEQALGAFETALSAEEDEVARAQLRMERALSLKRLRRFQEAADELRSIMRDERAGLRVEAAINLATVYLMDRRPQEAVQELRLVLRTHAQHQAAGHIWANLGMAYEQLGDYTQAAETYQRAIAADPGLGQVQLLLAAVYMDHLGDPLRALTALEAAYEQGYATRDSAIRQQACLIVLGQHDRAAWIAEGLRDSLGPAEAHAAEQEVAATITRLETMVAERAAAGARPIGEEPEPEESWQAPDDLILPGVIDLDPTFRRAHAGKPFLMIRINATTHQYLVAFFADTARADYADAFVTALANDRERLELDQQGLELRETPLLFTRCPGCGGHVLTNFEPSKWLTCRWCATEAPVTEITDPALALLLNEVTARIGRTPVDLSGHIQVLVVETVSAAQAEAVQDVAAAAGFLSMPNQHPAVLQVLISAIDAGATRLVNPFRVAVFKPIEPNTRTYRELSPPDIERLVTRLRTAVGPLQTVSTTFMPRPTDRDAEAGAVPDIDDDVLISHAEERLARNADDMTSRQLLAELAVQHGDLHSAERHACAGTARWPAEAYWWALLGRIHFRAGRFAPAAEAMEHSLELDPLQPSLLQMLGTCLAALDRTHEAQAMWARSEALGGGWGGR